MTREVHRPIELTLSYVMGRDDLAQGVFESRPLDPAYTGELTISVYTESRERDDLPADRDSRLQVQFGGSARALEAFGTYLVALALLQTPDPEPHEHFEDVLGENGESVHLIVRRVRSDPDSGSA